MLGRVATAALIVAMGTMAAAAEGICQLLYLGEVLLCAGKHMFDGSGRCQEQFGLGYSSPCLNST